LIFVLRRAYGVLRKAKKIGFELGLFLGSFLGKIAVFGRKKHKIGFVLHKKVVIGQPVFSKNDMFIRGFPGLARILCIATESTPCLLPAGAGEVTEGVFDTDLHGLTLFLIIIVFVFGNFLRKFIVFFVFGWFFQYSVFVIRDS